MGAVLCPDRGRLHEHLKGLLPEAVEAPLVKHLDTCVNCQQTLEELAGASEIWLTIARQVNGEAPVPEPAMDILWQKLREPGYDRQAATDGVLASLNPSSDSEKLGTLGHFEVLEVIGQGGMGV